MRGGHIVGGRAARPGGLLRGVPLSEAERWLQERPDDLGDTEREFIRASQVRRGRSVRRLRATVAALTVLLLLATGLGGYATVQSREVAKQSRQLARQVALVGARSLIDQAQKLADRQPDVAMLLAASAYRMARTPEAVSLVTRLATRERQVERIVATGAGQVLGARFDLVDPNRLVLYGPDAITVWDVAPRRAVRHWLGPGG